MVELKQGSDGVFRDPGHDEPLPYGLHSDPQEPYVAIIAPNLDKISAAAFDPRTLGGRRTRRGMVAFCLSLAGCLVAIGSVVAVQSILGLLGIE